jgi:hypothetical protein
MSLHEIRMEMVRAFSDQELNAMLADLMPDTPMHAACLTEALRRCK